MGERLGGKGVVAGENWDEEGGEEEDEEKEDLMGLKETCVEGKAFHPFLA